MFYRFSLLVLLACLSVTACTNITPVEQQFSGYLGDYSGLEPVATEDGGKAMRWIAPVLAQRTYTKMQVQPIGFYPEPQPGSQVSLERLNDISAAMTRALETEIGKDFELVTEPGPQTATIKFALTGVETPTEGLKAYNAIPVSLLVSGVTYAAGERDHVIVVYLEGQFLDSVSGEVLAKGVRQTVAGSLENEREEVELEKLQSFFESWSSDIATLARRLKRE